MVRAQKLGVVLICEVETAEAIRLCVVVKYRNGALESCWMHE